MNKEQVARLFATYLEMNPMPTNKQIGHLQAALAFGKEELDAALHEIIADATIDPQSEAEKVLDGEYDPNTTSSDDLLLNDGAPEGTSNQQQTQDATLDDGVAPDDIGVDVNGDKDALIDDGATVPRLQASNRLVAWTSDDAPTGTGVSELMKALQQKGVKKLSQKGGRTISMPSEYKHAMLEPVLIQMGYKKTKSYSEDETWMNAKHHPVTIRDDGDMLTVEPYMPRN